MAANPLGESLLNFSIDLYKQLISESGRNGNIFYSPFSISAALSMALGGARNTTAKELTDVLHVNSDDIHKHFSGFFSQLSGFAPDVSFHVANRMYAEQTFPVLDSYLSLLQDSYGATIESVDFQKNYENVRHEVNAWVKKVTESKIKNLLAEGTVDSLTILILVNAAYFKGLWSSQFNPNFTHRSHFHLDSKNKMEVDRMYQQNDYKMARSDQLEVSALEIPYRGGRTSMVVLLPDSIGGLSKLEKTMTASNLSDLLKNLCNVSNVELYLPKFKLEQAINLKETLKAMGIKDFFTPAADLRGISDKGNLMASEVVHKAFVEVKEGTTEAASPAPVKKMCYSLSGLFVVDRPFMFLIRSLDPELVLFMGSVRQL